MITDLRGQTVLIVAAGPPLAEALAEAFVAHGATCVHADALGFERLLDHIHGDGGKLDVLIHAGEARLPTVDALEDYSADALSRAVTAGAWPVFAGLLRVRSVFGRAPRYTIAISSTAPARFTPGGDFAAANQALLEALCRYVNQWMADEDARMNVLRHLIVPGADPRRNATLQEVARAAVALCSGLLDSMRGQVLTVDRGASFCDNVFRDFEEHSSGGR